MVGAAMVRSGDCQSLRGARPELEHMVRGASPVQQAYDAHARPLVERLMAIALGYAQEAGLCNAAVEVRDDVAVIVNAPFVGEVALCGIEDGQIVPYF